MHLYIFDKQLRKYCLCLFIHMGWKFRLYIVNQENVLLVHVRGHRRWCTKMSDAEPESVDATEGLWTNNNGSNKQELQTRFIIRLMQSVQIAAVYPAISNNNREPHPWAPAEGCKEVHLHPLAFENNIICCFRTKCPTNFACACSARI